jgi:hypothetical protein
MNKKQLVVAWVIGVVISFWFILLGLCTLDNSVDFALTILYGFVTPVIILGSLLLYTLRDKKK